MQISIGVVPGPDAVRRAQLAEELGFDRVWLYDSAAIYEDIWVNLANIVQATSIDVGTAVLVPNLRHVMTTASAIATIERMAPGRLTVGFGTGLTARWVLGKSALSWATLRRYVEQLHGLLQGEVVEVDGARAQMIHRPALAAPRPIHTPLLLSALGPKGQAITEEMVAAGTVDGLIDVAGVPGSFGRHVQMVSGTVLDPGESPGDARVRDAVGPWYVVSYHYVWTEFPDAAGGHARWPGVAGRDRGRAPRGRAAPGRARGTRHRGDRSGSTRARRGARRGHGRCRLGGRRRRHRGTRRRVRGQRRHRGALHPRRPRRRARDAAPSPPPRSADAAPGTPGPFGRRRGPATVGP